MSCVFSSHYPDLDSLLQAKAKGQEEFHQAVKEFAYDIEDLLQEDPRYKEYSVFERMLEPERIISFQVAWQNDQGAVEVNRGYRVQMNGAVGIYKGGLRFHPSVCESVLKFLAFEQTFKNALTGMSMGGAKGGSDFNPKGRSEAEILRFCSAFMQELKNYIHPDRDVPAGDINVGAKEIGYLFGAYRRITNQFVGVISGKGLSFGGSELRVHATGYGVLYFLEEMLKCQDEQLQGKKLLISGAGNVASYAAEKALELGAIVLTLSDSGGTLYNENGFTQEAIEAFRSKKEAGGSLSECAGDGYEWFEGERPWRHAADGALPCATENELDESDVKSLVQNRCRYLVEGANMPLTEQAQHQVRASDMIYAPGKAANAGGVSVSSLELHQNRSHISMSEEAVDAQLREIMRNIHQQCVDALPESEKTEYAKGANRASFLRVAKAMIAQGVG